MGGGVELHFEIERGLITRAQMFTDSLNPAPLELLAERLHQVTYRSDEIGAIVEQLAQEFPEQQAELRELKQWLSQQVK